jgi:tryptophan-rich sensory protein
LGGWVTADSVKTWYTTINKPSFTPPNWVFGPVWTGLYVLMGVAAWRVWCKAWPNQLRVPLALFAVQLALNLAWSVVFFGAHRIGGAVVVIVGLEAAILATMVAFRRIDGLAALLLMPYALWVAFAAVLNIAVWQLN